jgi:hypothetical protein
MAHLLGKAIGIALIVAQFVFAVRGARASADSGVTGISINDEPAWSRWNFDSVSSPTISIPHLEIFMPQLSPITRNSIPLFLSDIASTQQDSGSDVNHLAKELANPVSSLISVPLQSNLDFGGGLNHGGFRYTLNIQPVIPFKLSEDWNLITRIILPVIYQNKMFDNTDQFGLGDTNASLFFSPAKPGPAGLIWAVGPVFLIPTSTAQFLGAHRWGIGPTGIVLKQDGPWTYGILANHIWSIGRDISFNSIGGNSDVSNTFLQPFISYNFGRGFSMSLNTETTFNWKSWEWTVPINLWASQVVPIAGHPVSFAFGVRGYAGGPQGTPEWGLRLVATLLFPEK